MKHLSKILLLVFLLIGCEEKHVIEYGLSIPEEFFTVKAELISFPKEIIQLQYNSDLVWNGYVEYYRIQVKENGDLFICYPSKNSYYYIYVRKIQNRYLAYYSRSHRKIGTSARSGVDTLFSSYLNIEQLYENSSIQKEIIHEPIDSIVVDFTKNISDLSFFKHIKIYPR